MIPHECIGIKIKWIPNFIFGKKRKIDLKVLLLQEDILPLVTSGNDMIKGVREMNSRPPSHVDLLSQKGVRVNSLLSMPDPSFCYLTPVFDPTFCDPIFKRNGGKLILRKH